MRLHERTMKVNRARAELHNYILDFSEQHDLTDAETSGILIYLASRFNLFILRQERHPEDPEKKADEA